MQLASLIFGLFMAGATVCGMGALAWGVVELIALLFPALGPRRYEPGRTRWEDTARPNDVDIIASRVVRRARVAARAPARPANATARVIFNRRRAREAMKYAALGEARACPSCGKLRRVFGVDSHECVRCSSPAVTA